MSQFSILLTCFTPKLPMPYSLPCSNRIRPNLSFKREANYMRMLIWHGEKGFLVINQVCTIETTCFKKIMASIFIKKKKSQYLNIVSYCAQLPPSILLREEEPTCHQSFLSTNPYTFFQKLFQKPSSLLTAQGLQLLGVTSLQAYTYLRKTFLCMSCALQLVSEYAFMFLVCWLS